MTREELIARIEAGETGPELLCAIADIAGWTPNGDSSLSEILAFYMGPKDSAFAMTGVPAWLTSLDAAIALVGDRWWEAYHDGFAIVWTEDGDNAKAAKVSNNPAAALVAAWLKATA